MNKQRWEKMKREKTYSQEEYIQIRIDSPTRDDLEAYNAACAKVRDLKAMCEAFHDRR